MMMIIKPILIMTQMMKMPYNIFTYIFTYIFTMIIVNILLSNKVEQLIYNVKNFSDNPINKFKSFHISSL